MSGPGFRTPGSANGTGKRSKIGSPAPFRGMSMHSMLHEPIIYKRGPVKLFSNSEDDRRLGLEPGIGKDYDGYRVAWAKTGGFSVAYNYLGDLRESPIPAKPTREEMIGQFKKDVAKAAMRRPEIRKFLVGNPKLVAQDVVKEDLYRDGPVEVWIGSKAFPTGIIAKSYEGYRMLLWVGRGFQVYRNEKGVSVGPYTPTESEKTRFKEDMRQAAEGNEKLGIILRERPNILG